jgi:predicted nucleic acid-binding protein
MATKEISIRVSDQAAEAYRVASPDERRKLDALLSMRLTEAMRSERTLEEVMSKISRRAHERGLTPEKLQEILNDDA